MASCGTRSADPRFAPHPGPLPASGEREPTPKKEKPRSFRSGVLFQPIGWGSEVTGDAEAAGEAARVAVPSRVEVRAAGVAEVVHRSDEAGRPILLGALIHQLEVEVQVGDR